MLTTISEQSQLLSPKKLLALQKQTSISEYQQPGISSVKGGISISNSGTAGLKCGANGSNPLANQWHTKSDKIPSPEKTESINTNAGGGVSIVDLSATNGVRSRAQSTVIDEKCHNSQHSSNKTLFSTASVGHHALIG